MLRCEQRFRRSWDILWVRAQRRSRIATPYLRSANGRGRHRLLQQKAEWVREHAEAAALADLRHCTTFLRGPPRTNVSFWVRRSMTVAWIVEIRHSFKFEGRRKLTRFIELDRWSLQPSHADRQTVQSTVRVYFWNWKQRLIIGIFRVEN